MRRPAYSQRHTLRGRVLDAATGQSANTNPRSALTSVTVGPRAYLANPDVLVVLFLRGGADGLNIVVPYGDEDYYRLRPSLAIPPPNRGGAASNVKAIALDGLFGLHPALAPLYPLWQEGQLALVHAVGSGDRTRSHFEAMATMERGWSRDTGGEASGWLARHLLTTAYEEPAPLRAVAISDTLPESLRGAPTVTVLHSLSNFSLVPSYKVPTGSGGKVFHAETGSRLSAIESTLHRMYDVTRSGSSEERVVQQSGTASLKAMEAIRTLDPLHYRPAGGAVYPKEELGNGLRQVACLIKGEIGLEVACLDVTGWDTHVDQGGVEGWQASLLKTLADGLAAFARDLGPAIKHVTVLVMTEFGRRAYENAAAGTDHGRASVMMVLGGGIRGGKVFASWPGLNKEALEGPGDLHVTTDYRDVLAEVLALRMHNNQVETVFAGYKPRFLGVAVPKKKALAQGGTA